MASRSRRSPSRRFLPPDPRVEEPYRLTPRIALRVGVLGMVALAAFAVLFLRLWALQVLSGPKYLRAAQSNQLRTVRVPAPRGPILDRTGKVLVTNVAGNAVQIWPHDLPRRGRYAELKRLSEIVHVPVESIVRQIAERADDPLTPVTVKHSVHPDQVMYLSEHQAEFPGVEIAQSYLRRYRYQSLAAHLLGYVTEVSKDQLEQRSLADLRPGDEIGQAGVEATYDGYLRGTPGLAKLRVDSLGRPQSDLVLSQQPEAGYRLRLTIDLQLQQAAERALRLGIRAAQGEGAWAANAGAVIAMDPNDGAVLAMASWPKYKPSVYVGRIDPKKLAPLVDNAAAEAKNFPAQNRAIDGTYPPGSTFKPVTALAALQEHVITPYGSLPCTGSYTVYRPDGSVAQTFKNWDTGVNQPMALPTALAASCDTYFYDVGYSFYKLPPDRGHPLQEWATRLGFGSRTGIDIGPEAAGLLPTPEWRLRTFTRETDPKHWQEDRLWKPGDSIQLAIGQKDLLVTPLQMARLYSLIANGGRLVTPHLLLAVEQAGSTGSRPRVLRSYAQGSSRPSGVDPYALSVVRQGLLDATHQSYGTSVGVFGNFPVSIAGKTGTAEKVRDLDGYPRPFDQAWWCGYGPSDDPKLVVCALIENGGHGGTAAAPVALRVFEKYFGRRASSTSPVSSD